MSPLHSRRGWSTFTSLLVHFQHRRLQSPFDGHIGSTTANLFLILSRFDNSVVTPYTRRSLIELSNKLPAVSTLARLAHKNTSAKHQAGLLLSFLTTACAGLSSYLLDGLRRQDLASGGQMAASAQRTRNLVPSYGLRQTARSDGHSSSLTLQSSYRLKSSSSTVVSSLGVWTPSKQSTAVQQMLLLSLPGVMANSTKLGRV